MPPIKVHNTQEFYKQKLKVLNSILSSIKENTKNKLVIKSKGIDFIDNKISYKFFKRLREDLIRSGVDADTIHFIDIRDPHSPDKMEDICIVIATPEIFIDEVLPHLEKTVLSSEKQNTYYDYGWAISNIQRQCMGFPWKMKYCNNIVSTPQL